MKIKSLSIVLQQSWQPNAGQYVATVEFEDNSKNEIKLVLDSGISAALLAVAGPAIAQFSAIAANQVADGIRQSLEEARKPLEIGV